MAFQALLAGQTYLSKTAHYVCLDADARPTDGVLPGALLTVIDTGVRYVARPDDEGGAEWVLLPEEAGAVLAGGGFETAEQAAQEDLLSLVLAELREINLKLSLALGGG